MLNNSPVRRRLILEPDAEEPGPPVEALPVPIGAAPVRAALLWVAGAGLVIALGWIAVSLGHTLQTAQVANPVTGAQQDLSAIQVMQLYVQACFEGLCAVGVAMGVYFVARVFDAQ